MKLHPCEGNKDSVRTSKLNRLFISVVGFNVGKNKYFETKSKEKAS